MRIAWLAVAISLVTAQFGCGGEEKPPPVTFTIGGTITGVTGSGLVIGTPGQPDLAVSAGATSFAFANGVPSGTAYAVTVVSTPAGQECGVVSPRGTVVADVTTVAVWCGPGWAMVAGGTDHSAAVKTDGTLWAWGSNIYGQLGDGTTTDSYSPLSLGR